MLFDDYTVRTVALGAAGLGIVSGALGTFAVLRRQALVGDAVSHAALPGIVLAYLVTGSKASLGLLLGAAITGFLAVLLVTAVIRTTRVKADAALGLWLASFFGVGLVLLTFVQRRPDASQAGLDRFLFGQAATVLREDVWTIAIVGAIALSVLALAWKQMKLLAFDPDFGTALGLRMRLADVLLTGLLVVATVIGLQMVGAVLMSAMLIAPTAAARQWSDRLGRVTLLAGLFGAVAGVVGAVASSRAERLPTGPTIVLAVAAIVLLSFLFAPTRGIAMRWLRARSRRGRLALNAVLESVGELEQQHGSGSRGHAAETIGALIAGDPRVALEQLARRGLVARTPDGLWTLTVRGREELDRR
ncbi:MAG: metal ABC transporter permease [Actinobacteria bacterium]|nr:metal ABC transporter permease [Actinomycetota bacterium]